MYNIISVVPYFLFVVLLFLPPSSSIHHQTRRPAYERHRRRLLGEPGGVPSFHKPAPDLWFRQKLDHFDPLNNETWLQRYQVNETFFSHRADSPVFLMVGGEGAISSKWMAAGAWQMYAEKYGALCLQLEHRYYGKSWPKPDMSTENLRYLSSEQALADIAYFIQGINDMNNFTRDNYWVLFGGSYPGSLAAWARSKYEHLVHQSISSSGPLEAVADFPQYNEVVSDALESVSADCVDQTHQAALQVEKTVKHPIGGVLVSKLFNLCKPLDVANKKDVSTLAESLSGNFDEVVQYNNDNRITNDPKPLLTMKNLCDMMINRSLGSPMDRYAAVNRMMLDRNNQKCLDASYLQTVKDLQNTTFNPEEGARQWTYQTCTEFGFYQTSSTRKELFGSLFNFDYFVEQCQDVFGEDFGRERLVSGIERTNIIFGGKGISTSRVMFVHGSVDPWHVLGITESDNHLLPAIFMVGTAHCADMYPPSNRDLKALTRARELISNHIGQWLMRPHKRTSHDRIYRKS